MKLISTFCLLFVYGMCFSQYFDTEVTVGKPDSYMSSYYYHTPVFNDRYNQEGEQTFSFGNADFYKRKNVKHTEVRDLEGELYFFWDRDTIGRIIQSGEKQANYFVIQKTVSLEGMKYCTVAEYWQNELLMKVDSTFADYPEYHSADTVFAYGITEITGYMRGSLINERNRYYNEKYEGKYRDMSNSLFVYHSHESQPYLYFEENFRTDYDSLTLYKTEHIRHASGFHHYIRQNQLEWDSVSTHPFFRHLDTLTISDYFTDGADFQEPVVMQQRMWCGNSLYNQMHYQESDDGIRHYYSRNELGLQDTFYIDFYPEDPNPPVPDTNAIAATPNLVLVQYNGYRHIPRLAVPVRTPKFVFCYEFFEERH